MRVATASSKNPASHACALPQRIRAGCDAGAERQLSRHVLCHSAFARVATPSQCNRHGNVFLCLSAFARVATTSGLLNMTGTFFASAHSRGLRRHLMKDCDCETDLCLSAFVRVATSVQTIYSNLTELCHSAFVRVATSSSPLTMWTATFATAHSCGLRPIATNYAKSGKRFATAHSRGLRRRTCRSAVRVEPFATAHSCGLRPSFSSFAPSSASFATAHSCGLRRNHDYSD